MGCGDGSTRTVAQQIIFHRNWKWILDLPHSFYYLAGGGGGVTATAGADHKVPSWEGGAEEHGTGEQEQGDTLHLTWTSALLLPWKYDI